jgi:uncharacterized membrane protein YdjX (TVP38/TMEM64 family)
MRFFIALVVFAIGVGLYAAAALVFDRRRTLRVWLNDRRARNAPAGGLVQVVTATPLALVVAGCLVVGTILVFGSCAGLILW